MRSKKEEAIRKEIKEKFGPKINATTKEYTKYYIEQIRLDGWYKIDELRQIVDLMEKAKIEFDEMIKVIDET